jgi:hypothetical protein
MSVRPSGRAPDELRPLSFERGYTKHAEGSVLVGFGAPACCARPASRTACRRSCAAGPGLGDRRIRHAAARDAHALGARGGARQADRPHPGDPALIGRALRAVVDLKALGERTVTIDCDVLQADGGTRTAAITGGFVALADAVDTLLKRRASARIRCTARWRRFGGHLPRHAGARPRLRRGFERRDRHERGHEQRRRLRRSAGHRRRPCVSPPRARSVAGSRERRASRPCCTPRSTTARAPPLGVAAHHGEAPLGRW